MPLAESKAYTNETINEVQANYGRKVYRRMNANLTISKFTCLIMSIYDNSYKCQRKSTGIRLHELVGQARGVLNLSTHLKPIAIASKCMGKREKQFA